MVVNRGVLVLFRGIFFTDFFTPIKYFFHLLLKNRCSLLKKPSYLSVGAVHQHPKSTELGAMAADMSGISVHKFTIPCCPKASGLNPAVTKKSIKI